MKQRLLALCLPLMVIAGCAPELPGEPWRITEPRILAVRSEPADVYPGDTVSYRALTALDPPDPDWYLCTRNRSLEERRSIAPECLDDPSVRIPIADESAVIVPSDACRIFGPEVVNDDPTTPPPRANDPDPSGGYYQPVLAEGNPTTVGFTRLRCNLPHAPSDVAAQWNAQYVPNARPNPVSIELDGAPSPTVSAGQAVSLTLAWNGDPLESYLRYEIEDTSIVGDRETVTIHWYVTAGDLTHAGIQHIELDAPVVWTPPPSAQPVTIWAVAYDSRGGVGWIRGTIDAQ